MALMSPLAFALLGAWWTRGGGSSNVKLELLHRGRGSAMMTCPPLIVVWGSAKGLHEVGVHEWKSELFLFELASDDRLQPRLWTHQ